MNKLLLVLISFLSLSVLDSCKTAHYLPLGGEPGQYGAQITLYSHNGNKVKGELIAVLFDKLIVLTDNAAKCSEYKYEQIKEFTLRYATPVRHIWAIPAYSVLCVPMHGAFSLISLPTNLVTTGVISIWGNQSYKYNSQQVTYSELSLYSRYPGGLPVGIDMSQLKN